MERHIQIPPRLALALTILFIPFFLGVGLLFWRAASLPDGSEHGFIYQTVGMMFVAAGVLLGMTQIPSRLKGRRAYKWVEYVSVLPIWFGFVLVFVWISIAPDSGDLNLAFLPVGGKPHSRCRRLLAESSSGLERFWLAEGRLPICFSVLWRFWGFAPKKLKIPRLVIRSHNLTVKRVGAIHG